MADDLTPSRSKEETDYDPLSMTLQEFIQECVKRGSPRIAIPFTIGPESEKFECGLICILDDWDRYMEAIKDLETKLDQEAAESSPIITGVDGDTVGPPDAA